MGKEGVREEGWVKGMREEGWVSGSEEDELLLVSCIHSSGKRLLCDLGEFVYFCLPPTAMLIKPYHCKQQTLG